MAAAAAAAAPLPLPAAEVPAPPSKAKAAAAGAPAPAAAKPRPEAAALEAKLEAVAKLAPPLPRPRPRRRAAPLLPSVAVVPAPEPAAPAPEALLPLPTPSPALPASVPSRAPPPRCTVGDQLFLPPRVLMQRRQDPGHWANPENGWRPTVAAPPVVQKLPTHAADQEDDSWTLQRRRDKDRRRERLARREYLSEESLDEGEPLNSGDDPDGGELLSPEEAAQKRAIWNEVNKDLLEFWHMEAQQRREKLRKHAERQAWLEDEERFAEEADAGRRRRARKGAAPPPPQEELAPEVLDFWKVHGAAREEAEAYAAAGAPRASVEELEVARQHAEAREAVAKALREEKELQREAERRARKAKHLAEGFAAMLA